ncbi:hypothetical protein DEH18_18710 [Streptomyces sp. NHF165]|uniref:hypothetical protein n=1 Tax=Streptomyces sp. NHF165 TaxID=2175864 RepID=UPI00132F1288|nr:hypothetical protein [Streptomyces sp. NHF165]QHF95542.1 hypothetical protein DEH18_18710 [Streptomyces sp. NHF165]
MSDGTRAQDLRTLGGQLAGLLWRQHSIYRERNGGIVIRGEHVARWISLSAGGTRQLHVRAGRLLEGGTTAPARAEAVVPRECGLGELAGVCRRLLAETAGGGAPEAPARHPAPDRAERGARRSARPGDSRRRRARWTAGVVLALAAAALAAGLVR